MILYVEISKSDGCKEIRHIVLDDILDFFRRLAKPFDSKRAPKVSRYSATSHVRRTLLVKSTNPLDHQTVSVMMVKLITISIIVSKRPELFPRLHSYHNQNLPGHLLLSDRDFPNIGSAVVEII
jgi:hypothetical protein